METKNAIRTKSMAFARRIVFACRYLCDEKKEYVLTRINQLAIENGINFDVKAISDKIEELIKLSKEVNYKKTNEEEE